MFSVLLLASCSSSKEQEPLTTELKSIVGFPGNDTTTLLDSVSRGLQVLKRNSWWSPAIGSKGKFSFGGRPEEVVSDFDTRRIIDTNTNGYPIYLGLRVEAHLSGSKDNATLEVYADYDSSEVDTSGNRRHLGCYGSTLFASVSERFSYRLPNGMLATAIRLREAPLDTNQQICKGLHIEEIIFASGYGMIQVKGSLQSLTPTRFNRITRRFNYKRQF